MLRLTLPFWLYSVRILRSFHNFVRFLPYFLLRLQFETWKLEFGSVYTKELSFRLVLSSWRYIILLNVWACREFWGWIWQPRRWWMWMNLGYFCSGRWKGVQINARWLFLLHFYLGVTAQLCMFSLFRFYIGLALNLPITAWAGSSTYVACVQNSCLASQAVKWDMQIKGRTRALMG